MPQLLERPNARTEQVPVEACRFAAADFKPGAADSAGTVPFTALARTAKPVSHWYWGERCLHDFSGMETAEVLPVDYNHDDREALGVINSRTVDAAGLHLSGSLIPFADDDRASEVAFKAAKGMPYQASVYWDPFSTVVEEVPEGYSTECNGQTWQGPITVFRQWKLLGLAVCLYGVDAGTTLDVTKLSGQKAAVTRFSKGAAMPDPVPTPTPAPVPTPTPAPEVKTETPPVTPPAVPAPTPPVAPVVTPPTQLSRAEAAKPFITAFGAQHGPTLFAKHDTIEAAQVDFNAILKAENDALRQEVAKFAKGPQGETPASPNVGAPATPELTKWSGLSPAMQKVCGAIKMPGGK